MMSELFNNTSCFNMAGDRAMENERQLSPDDEQRCGGGGEQRTGAECWEYFTSWDVPASG